MHPEAQQAANNLYALRALTGDHHTPPAEHYLNAIYLWDTCFHAIVYAKAGDTSTAQDELMKLFEGQINVPGPWYGFLANMQSFANGKRLINPEDWFRNHPEHSDYSQPPIIALAVKRTYEALGENTPEAQEFLRNTYPNLVKFYSYFRQNRENKDSHLIGVIHPSETGRDSDPTFDDWSLRIGVDYRQNTRLAKALGIVNTGLDFASKMVSHDLRNRLVGWDPEKIRKHFWVNDVMFNAMYVENLRILGGFAEKLGRYDESQIFNRWAQQTKTDMDRLMMGNDGLYHAFGNKGMISQISVSNLFPIIFDDLGKDSLLKILNLFDDENIFNTPVPIPSVPIDDPKCDPHFLEKRLWRGPVWTNMSWYLVTQGLLKQAKIYAISEPDLSQRCLMRASCIADKSLELVHKADTWEFYDTEKNKGYRVGPFGWSNLAYIIAEEVDEVKQELGC